MAARYVRMKDIAAQAGCTTMAVSLALRNSPRISAEMKERIRRLAETMGYRPDPFVSAFVIRRSKPEHAALDVLAVLTKFGPPLRAAKHSGAFFFELWNGLEERAAELGFRLEEYPVGGTNPPTGRELTRILTTRGIRGVILFPGGGLDRHYPELDWKHFSLVAVGFHATTTRTHRIASDYSLAMETALTEIGKRGYRRPGLAMTNQLDAVVRYALSGRFLSWQMGQPRSRRVPLVPGKDALPDPEALLDWMNRHEPDVILGLDFTMETLSKLLIGSGREVGLVHLAKKKKDRFAGVNLRTHDVGRVGIDVLTRELYLNRTGLPQIPEVILVSGSWEEGSTLRGSA